MNEFEEEVKNVAIQAARQGARILNQHFGQLTQQQVEFKDVFDFVTHVDRDSEQAIIHEISSHFPEHDIFAEEQGKIRQASEFCWIIDPLDGTTNFIHGFPCFSISIALKRGEQTIFGLVYDPQREELFHAFHGKGAFRNDQPIRTSQQKMLNQALVATGFPFRDKTTLPAYLKSFAEIFEHVAGIRRAGSAALDLCYTACGRVDAFWELGLNTWDIAAGILIVREAGGIVSNFQGGQNYFRSGNVLAGNPFLHEKLLELCHRHLEHVFMQGRDRFAGLLVHHFRR